MREGEPGPCLPGAVIRRERKSGRGLFAGKKVWTPAENTPRKYERIRMKNKLYHKARKAAVIMLVLAMLIQVTACGSADSTVGLADEPGLQLIPVFLYILASVAVTIVFFNRKEFEF